MIEMTPQQLKTKLDNGEAIDLVDLRDAHTYEEKHIPRATNIVAGENFVMAFTTMVKDKDAVIVLYNNFKEDASDTTSAEVIEGLGYKNVMILPDGLMGWMNAGFQVDGGRES